METLAYRSINGLKSTPFNEKSLSFWIKCMKLAMTQGQFFNEIRTIGPKTNINK